MIHLFALTTVTTEDDNLLPQNTHLQGYITLLTGPFLSGAGTFDADHSYHVSQQSVKKFVK